MDCVLLIVLLMKLMENTQISVSVLLMRNVALEAVSTSNVFLHALQITLMENIQMTATALTMMNVLVEIVLAILVSLFSLGGDISSLD